MRRTADPGEPTNLPSNAPLRRTRGGPELAASVHDVKVIAPRIGGGAQARAIDEEDLFRGSEVRQALRFWWRALQRPPVVDTSDSLRKAEVALFGDATDEEGGSVSTVSVVVRRGDSNADGGRIDYARPEETYAVAGVSADELGHVRRPKPADNAFDTFSLSVLQPPGALDRAVAAWGLFGGYGGRTRRGLGAVHVAGIELDAQDLAGSLGDLLGVSIVPNEDHPRVLDIEPSYRGKAYSFPSLLRAKLFIGPESRDPIEAWRTSVGWLQRFCQEAGPDETFARRQRYRTIKGRRVLMPSMSRHSEPDILRHLLGPLDTDEKLKHYANQALYLRAALGLPRPIRWIEDRRGATRRTIRWVHRSDRTGEHASDRLASPLILRAIPTTNGGYLPAALWMRRLVPPGQPALFLDGQLVDDSRAEGWSGVPREAPEPDPETGVQTDRRYKYIAESKGRIRDAFFAFLKEKA